MLLFILEHLDRVSSCRYGRFQLFFLPVCTSLAYSLEKVFNTGVGFAPHRFWEAPQWITAYVFIGILGVLDFYLNTLAAERMSMQTYIPAVFAVQTCLCYFQSTCILGEMRHLSTFNFAVSCLGMFMALLGGLLIQVRTLLHRSELSESIISQDVSLINSLNLDTSASVPNSNTEANG